MKTRLSFLAMAALGLATLMAAPSPAKAADYCREYTRSVVIGHHTQPAYGTACLQPDGSWRIVSEDLGGGQPVVPNEAVAVGQPVYSNTVTYVEPAPVYTTPVYAAPVYRPVYARPVYYQPAPVSFGFFFGNTRHDHGWHGGWHH